LLKTVIFTSCKPKYACRVCGRQFVKNPKNKPISKETRDFIDKLLLERISLAGIARVTGVSEEWLLL
jgi:insertion element IS1 protein InsB